MATEEISYGDNARLAARTARLARADLLVLLSDMDGLYDADPRKTPSAAHQPPVEALTPSVLAMAGCGLEVVDRRQRRAPRTGPGGAADQTGP